MHDEAKLVAILGELAGALDGRTFLDVLENLLISGLVADDKQAAASILHGLKGFEVGGDAGRARPGQAQGF